MKHLIFQDSAQAFPPPGSLPWCPSVLSQAGQNPISHPTAFCEDSTVGKSQTLESRSPRLESRLYLLPAVQP